MIDLTRRKLLKFIGIGALAVMAPVPAKTAKAGPLTCRDDIPIEHKSVESGAPGFNPDSEYGRGLYRDGHTVKFATDYLHRDVRRVLPKGTPYELRLFIPGLPEYPELKAECAAWYYSPVMLRVGPPKAMSPKAWQYIPEYGVYAMGRFYA